MLDFTFLNDLYSGFSGEVSVAFQAIDKPDSYTHNPETTMLAASLIKLPILLATLEGVAQGRLELTERVPLRAEDRVSGSGVLKTLGEGLTPTLHDLLTLMIVVSDNTATNMVIEHIGLQTTNTFCAQHGFRATHLVGKLQLPEAQMNEAQRRGERNRTCAADMLGMLVGLVRGDLLPPTQTETALAILKAQQLDEGLARLLPTDEELDTPHLTVASKSGSVRGVRHDVGVVYRAGAPLYALVVMTSEGKDLRYYADNEGLKLIAEASRRIYNAVSEEGNQDVSKEAGGN